MWNNRNHILHNVHTDSDNRLSRRLDNRVRKEFHIDIDGLAPIHHYMVRRTRLARLLLWDNSEKSAWLATIKIARMAWKRKIKQSRQQRQMLRESMQPP
jgi:DNA-binding transcriptional regulator YbjK